MAGLCSLLLLVFVCFYLIAEYCVHGRNSIASQHLPSIEQQKGGEQPEIQQRLKVFD
jgi:hypothetical protein